MTFIGFERFFRDGRGFVELKFRRGAGRRSRGVARFMPSFGIMGLRMRRPQ